LEAEKESLTQEKAAPEEAYKEIMFTGDIQSIDPVYQG
jgi:hypothetical protein